MKPLDAFNIQQETIKVIRGMLKASPISYGNVLIDYMYRKHDTKTELLNYCEISFLQTDSRHGLACREDDVKGVIDCYAENEIMVSKIAHNLAGRLDNAMVTPVVFMINSQAENGVVELDKNKYSQRVTFKMVL
jgi:hypothetical protein